MKQYKRKTPGHLVDAPGRLSTLALSQRSGGRLLALECFAKNVRNKTYLLQNSPEGGICSAFLQQRQ